MTQITLEPALLDQLRAADGIVQMCDDSGRVIGTFLPAVDDADAIDEPALSNEELQRRAAEPGGRPLSEILADLKQRS